jgi:GR25 family glycosyltransferase involved in LPS biosynthesis
MHIQTLDSFFDKIYVINLPSSVERRNLIIKQFENLNLKNYEVFNAIDKNSLNINDLKIKKLLAYQGNTFYCDQNCTCGGAGHILSSGDIALNFSHREIYEDIIKNNYEKCLIMEDDCIFTDKLNDFDEITKNIPKDWDFLYLGNSNYINNNNSSDIGNKFFLKCLGVPCTHMYAININCIETIKSKMFPIRAAIDGFLHRFIFEKKLVNNVFICKLTLGINGSVENIFNKDY